MASKQEERVTTMQLVLFALLRRGGDERFVSTDEVALEAFRLYPGKFCWDEYSHLPQWDRVRQWLSEAKKQKHGVLVEGYAGHRGQGWRLTAAGVRLLRFKERALSAVETAAAHEGDYAEVPAWKLVCVALAEVRGSGEPVSIANLVAQCYRRFPGVFQLEDYAGWPDSHAIREALNDAISHQCAVASDDYREIQLIDKGIALASHVRSRLAHSVVAITLADIGKGIASKAGRKMREITKTRAWNAFQSGMPITRAAALEAIGCTLQSHPNAVRRALESYLLAAEDVDHSNAVEFLRECSRTIGIPLHGHTSDHQGEDRHGT